MWMKIIGHRGARGLAAENTIASIKKAIEYDIDEVEFDVRVTKDNIAVLHHDASFKTKSGARLTIALTTFSVLKKHKPSLTTLDEAMKFINHRVPALIEIKPGVNTEPVIACIRNLLKKRWHTKDILFESRDQKVLLKLHKTFPKIQTVVLEHWSGTRAIWKAHQVATKRITLSKFWLWNGFIWSMSKRGWEIYPYTMNNPGKAQRWERYGIAGVITDNPERFVAKKVVSTNK